jgi:hypothetical protein
LERFDVLNQLVNDHAPPTPPAGPPGGGGGLQPDSPPTPSPKNRNLKNTDFVDIMISKVLRDFSFSRNQPLKSADDSTLEF